MTKKGYKMTEEHKRKIALGRFGKRHTEEVKRRIGAMTSARAKHGSESHLWKGGGVRLYSDGRRYFGKRGHQPISRFIVEKELGRPLLRREIVHHINENKSDDRSENLFLFRHQSAHAKWHAYLRRHGLPGSLLQSNLGLYSVK